MIPCQSCGHQNPIATRFCRSCGVRLELKQEAVFKAVNDDLAEGRSLRWLARGNSAMAFGGFLLVCGLVLRYAVVPPFPRADIPPVDVGSVLPAKLPAVAPEAQPKADAAVPPKPAEPAKP